MKSDTANFILKNYGKESTFTSFLPGVSGVYGIPIWCYYVNRGQGVTSFGVEDKDHAIMEFDPAHQAYQNVKRTGFRTFLKKDGKYIEPFSDENIEHKMIISMNSFEIEEIDEVNGIKTNVTYYNLPGEKVGALVREVTIKNIGSNKANIEILDGMPAIVPYGVDMDSIKSMGQTIKAWMQVEDVEKNLPYYRVRVSTTDTADVAQVEGGNFSFAVLADGTRLKPLVDPESVFSYDTTLTKAVGFDKKGIEGLYKQKQVTQNQFPSSFYGTKCELEDQEEITIYQVIGQVASKDILNSFMSESKDEIYFEKKKEEADGLTNDLTSVIKTKTASEDFNAYCEYTYLDNMLRGGYPIKLGKNKVFYVYSRKHGDPERDYNYFTVSAEFFTQGNGNFRDINQNRRCDVFFAPFVANENIKMFYGLIQLDGYNPLAIEKITYAVDKDDAIEILKDISNEKKEALLDYICKPFTPGSLYKKIEESLEDNIAVTTLFNKVIDIAKNQVNSSFGEGYWSDHWTYNLDLIEHYLEIYPEKEEKLLFEKEYTYFLSQININPRHKRYTKTKNGIRQYFSLDEDNRRETSEKLVRDNYGKGEVVKSTLLEKLILLCATKFSTLDAYGMGVEMEGGKPGWYDALNGLPGIFGSSMAESYELARNLDFTIKMLRKYPYNISILKDLSQFIKDISTAVEEEKDSIFNDMEVISFWNKINDAKEKYRSNVYSGISGDRVSVDGKELANNLEDYYRVVEKGIEKACSLEDGICPTYFAYEVRDYEELEDGIMPKHFEIIKMPLFLEGPVNYFKLESDKKEKQSLYKNIKNSDLYDKKLFMYKVNASLSEASYEIGRAKAFTPGWLENESIWMHMEYKYLLELLKSGLYKEFFNDFHKAAIPFLDPKVYGRSIYENSSFIASSKNPNENYHGKGFVARLSGSTIEFINMWQIMMFGQKPFYVEDGELALQFEPIIPSYLIGDEHKISTTFLGMTEVNYILSEKSAISELIPGNYEITYMECVDEQGEQQTIEDSYIKGELASNIRDGKISIINVYIK